jgi:VanZ family protein
MKTSFRKWIPVILWMLVIFILSHQDASQSGSLSSGLLSRILSFLAPLLPPKLPLPFLHLLLRKGAHFTAYFILALLVLRTREDLTPNLRQKALLICALYAVTDEFHQTFIPGRAGQLTDVLLDTSGAALGILLQWGGTFLRQRNLKNRTVEPRKAS